MKKNNILYVCAAAALMFASCQKEAPTADIQQPSQSGLDVITATSSQTKTTTLDGVNVLWEKGDAIKLFTRTHNPADPEKPTAGWCDYNSTLQEASATATFERDASNTATVDKNDAGKYFAVYLKDATIVTQSRARNTTIALSKDQVAKNGGDFAASLMSATSENAEFTFKHLVSYIKFTVDANTTPFNTLTVATEEDSKYLVSRIKIDFASDLKISLDPVQSDGKVRPESFKTVTLTTDDGADFAPGTYYLAINADQYAEGFKITFANETSEYTISTPANITLNAGQVANLGTIGTLQFEEVKKLELATVFEENGKKQGVVFWIDPDNKAKGKIISVSSTETLQWSTSKLFTDKTTMDDGLTNTNQIMQSDAYKADPTQFPAIQYCADMRETLGGDWYMPAIYELQDLYNNYYNLSISSFPTSTPVDYRIEDGKVIDLTTKKNFDAALKLLGETTTASLDGDADGDGTSDNAGYGTAKGVTYWTSKVNSGGKIQYARFGSYENGNHNLNYDTKYYVRCVREVTLN